MGLRDQLLFVRTDKAQGDQSLVSYERLLEVVKCNYDDPDVIMRNAVLGHRIGTTFAVYQHRDFVPGWEREEPKK